MDADRPTVIRTSDAASNPEQADAVHDLVAAGANPIVVATRNPYDLSTMPDVGTYLTTYDDTPPRSRPWPTCWSAAASLPVSFR
ncbi:hypothetical protein [Haladaptatus sp. R4]|uniref:hypothetical protein n=1 Tax=Haladaptatus sp. R4 TaxID=1679489 RepID=UPI0016800480|nr:hypothetical protein [Haladaptatus sp. R4]